MKQLHELLSRFFRCCTPFERTSPPRLKPLEYIQKTYLEHIIAADPKPQTALASSGLSAWSRGLALRALRVLYASTLMVIMTTKSGLSYRPVYTSCRVSNRFSIYYGLRKVLGISTYVQTAIMTCNGSA